MLIVDLILEIHQTKYAHSLMDKFQLWNTTPADTPIEPNEKYAPHQGEPIDQPEYLMKVGALNWLATSTRPDLAYAMSRLARASRCPGPLDHAMLQRTLRYVRGTLDRGYQVPCQYSYNIMLPWISTAQQIGSGSGFKLFP